MNKSGIGKHWYHNNTQEGYFLECPEGWTKGRLPISDETRQKHRDNNGMKKLSDEQKIARSLKLKEAHKNQTEEQKRHKSEAISNATKGKNLGRIPWNKGKKNVQEAWNKGLSQPKTKEQIEHMIQSRSDTMQQNGTTYGKPKGLDAWNKGKHYHLDEQTRIEMVTKMTDSKRLNGTFNTSQPEVQYKEYLERKYGKDNVITQYSDSRYPYQCDFYIPALDLFIELNFSWTHGGHLFNKSNAEDLTLLEYWKEKALTSDYYKNAIETWTIRDVNKMNTALQNKLNYKVYYTEEEAYND